MRVALIAVLFAAAASANPFAWAAPQASLVPTASGTPGRHGNGSRKGNRTHRNPHKEPTPTFKLGCECPKPVVPVNLLSENEVTKRTHEEEPIRTDVVPEMSDATRSLHGLLSCL